MKIITLFFVLSIVMYSCSDPQVIEEKITPVPLSVTIQGSDTSAGVYHIYYKHNKTKNYSKGVVTDNRSNTLKLFPGIYTIYLYKLADKSTKYKMVESFSVIKDVKVFSRLNLTPQLTTLSHTVTYCRENDRVQISLAMDGLYELFTISSLSVQKGSSRSKSVSHKYNRSFNRYEAFIVLESDEVWSVNLSYALRSSKIEKTVLTQSGISISTRRFNNIVPVFVR